MNTFPKISSNREVRCRKSQVIRCVQHRFVAAACCAVVLFSGLPLIAQGTPGERLTDAYRLEKEGRPAPAIAEVKTLLDTKALDPAGVGKAWDILGLAFEDQGDFSQSRHAFEQSIQAYEGLGNVTSDYAMTLDDFGELYVADGQPELAPRMMERALSLYEAVQNHAGAARASSDLAGALFSQQKFREGRKNLDRALKEARLTNELDDDDWATLASLQGWLAQRDGDLRASVSKYQQSLDLLRKYHGEEHVSTGWVYVLLGEAHAEAGDLTGSLAEMDKGLAILGRTLNNQDPRFLSAEIAYSGVLNKAGRRSEAASLKASAERQLRLSHDSQCVHCTISAEAFR